MRISSGLLSGHVLQRTPRGASATVRGEVAESGPVTATITADGRHLHGWADKKVGVARGGALIAQLKGIPTGGPYEVTLTCGPESITVADIFVGDLWLMAGQSNMEGVGNLVDAPKPHPLVRCFNMDHRWSIARDPLHHLPESPDVVHNYGSQQKLGDRTKAKRNRIKGTGVGVFFGKRMVELSGGVPQGVISTAHGGTSMEQWDPAKKSLGGASLYGSMLSSMKDVDQPVAGVLWYQGCSDANPDAAPLYTERMERLVAAVRKDLKQPTLPWVVVQIARVVQEGGEVHWNSVQEQERLLPQRIRHLDTIPAVDLEIDDLIHISGKAYATLGERMARVAARLVLGKREAPAIQPTSVKIIDGYRYGAALEVRFANVVGGLCATGLPQGFAMVDGDHRPVPIIYKTVLDGDRVILELVNFDRSDLRLMYGWGKNPVCNITDARGMAVPVFGPIAVGNRHPVSPWALTWQHSAIRPGEDIARMPRPQAKAFGPLETKTWTGGNFVNQHPAWEGKSGHVAFFGTMELVEAMALELRTGYDGPFRLWIGKHEVVTDLKGTNPALADRLRKKLTLTKGNHPVTVLMALNGGQAWGFFLRFARLGVTKAQADTGKVAVPIIRA